MIISYNKFVVFFFLKKTSLFLVFGILFSTLTVSAQDSDLGGFDITDFLPEPGPEPEPTPFPDVLPEPPGKNAQRLRGTVFGGVHPSLLNDNFLSLKAIDGWRVVMTRGGSESALHFAPVPLLSELDGYRDAFPGVNNTNVQEYLEKIKGAGYLTQLYTNTSNFWGVHGDLQTQYREFLDSWVEWCDTNPEAQAFIDSQPYHRKEGCPLRHYFFCYAEFVIKHYSLTYGKMIDAWQFDNAHFELTAHGDSFRTGNPNDQRLYLAFAEAARAGNPRIAVSFSNGREAGHAEPYSPVTWADDFTFGHAFNGNNTHGTGAALTANRTFVTRMEDTDGYVHRAGPFDYDDNVVGNFSSKLSSGAWDFGSVMGWDQDVFNSLNARALSSGGMMTWYGSNNRTNSATYSWVFPMLKALDDHLVDNGISINSEQRFQPDPDKVYHIENPAQGTRLAATGADEGVYTTSLSVNTEDTRWRFIPTDDPGLYHIERAAGGEIPRLRTDMTTTPDMGSTSSDGNSTRFEFSQGNERGTYLLTLALSSAENTRLRFTASGGVNYGPYTSIGDSSSLRIVETEVTFDPDPNKLYHIESPSNGFRLASTGDSEDPYTTALNVSNIDTVWQFVESSTEGLWHIQRAAGGPISRLRTDLTAEPDMQESSNSGVWTQFQITASPTNSDAYLLTVPQANTTLQRLRILGSGNIDFTTTDSVGGAPSLRFVEADLYFSDIIEAQSQVLTGDNAASFNTSLTAINFSDGLPNLIKYAFNLDLTSADHHFLTEGGDSGLPISTVVSLQNGTLMHQFQYIQRAETGIIYTPQFSTTLEDSSFQDMNQNSITSDAVNEEWNRVTVGIPVNEESPRMFFRVKLDN